MRRVRIATRRSALALWQARHVAALVRQKMPAAEVTLLEMSTEGDRFLAAPLSTIGGKGLFVKELEQALLEERAELAVHSLKDLTSQMPEALCLAATPEREDPRDAFLGLSARTVAELPKGAKVGTSSLRRTCQLKARRPDLEIVPLRGNVASRLRKAQELGLDGSVLAMAGLKRLELDDQVTEVLEPEVSLPAVGQGALALQCRASDGELRAALALLDHGPTRTTVTAERAFLAKLEGGCSVPLAGFARLVGSEVVLEGLIGSPDGSRIVRGTLKGAAATAAEVGHALASRLLEEGGAEILRAFHGQSQGQG